MKKTMRLFPNCMGYQNIKIQYVYPLKQKQIGRIMENLAKDSRVEKVYIFGSSISNRCHRYSDVDIAVLFAEEHRDYETKKEICDIIWKCAHSFDTAEITNNVDLIWLDEVKIGGRLWTEIVDKGVRFI